MKAIFRTERVNYELTQQGFTRNGHFVQGEIRLKTLTIGQPAMLECKVKDYVQVIKTDVVVDIEECPAAFKEKMDQEVHPYRITVIREAGNIGTLMRIGTEAEVRRWVSKKYPDEEVSYRIAPIPTGIKGVVNS